MLINCKIQVLTVTNEHSIVAYQQVFVNDKEAAKREYDRVMKLYADVKGWQVALKTFD